MRAILVILPKCPYMNMMSNGIVEKKSTKNHDLTYPLKIVL